MRQTLKPSPDRRPQATEARDIFDSLPPEDQEAEMLLWHPAADPAFKQRLLGEYNPELCDMCFRRPVRGREKRRDKQWKSQN